MREWWHWSPSQGERLQSFGIVGVGRFGSAVCQQLLQNGAEVLAVDRSARAIEELRQHCLLYTSPSPRDVEESRMPSSA